MEDPKELMLEHFKSLLNEEQFKHFKNVIDAYNDLLSSEKEESEKEENFRQRFYDLINYKSKLI